MWEKRLLIGFLTFSMLILFILLGIFYYREYISKPNNLNEPINKEEYIEDKIVQSEVEKAEREEIVEDVVYYQIIQDVNYLKDAQETEEVQKSGTLQISFDELIINSAMADKDFVNKVIEHLQLIPNEILDTFYKDGWKICITRENLYNKLVLTESQKKEEQCIFISGLTKIEEKIIYIAYDDRVINNYTTIHEMGHYTDIMYKWPSCTERYKDIYIKEEQKLNSEIIINSNKELFAETFNYVILQKTEYESLETYQYVKDIIYHN